MQIIIHVLAVYNHWIGLDWTTGLPLNLKIQHYNGILVPIYSHTYVSMLNPIIWLILLIPVAYPLYMICSVAINVLSD